MGYREDGAVLELLPNGGLDKCICLGIHVGRGLVHHKDSIIPQYSPCQANQLALTHAKV